MKPQKRSRLLLFVAMGGALIGGYSALWWSLADALRTRVQDWGAAEAANGKYWSCSDTTLHGFPFSLRADCGDPQLRHVTPSGDTTLAAKRFAARASLLDPFAIMADVTGPARLISQDGALEVEWVGLEVALRWLPGQMEGVSLMATGLNVRENSGSFSAAAGVNVSTMEARLTRAATAGTWRAEARLFPSRVPLLDQALGDVDPVEGHVVSDLNEIRTEQPTLGAILDAWRAAGGTATLESVVFAKGALRSEGKGAISLDNERRLTGTINGRVAGLEPLLRRSGFKSGSPAGDAILKAMVAREPPNGVPVTVHFRDGRVYLGPLRTNLELRPVY
jgi:hypothetical protein